MKIRKKIPFLAPLGLSVASCVLIYGVIGNSDGNFYIFHRYIRMSSPNMNNIIILGCVLIYISGILLGIDSEVASGKAHERVCQVRQ